MLLDFLIELQYNIGDVHLVVFVVNRFKYSTRHPHLERSHVVHLSKDFRVQDESFKMRKPSAI